MAMSLQAIRVLSLALLCSGCLSLAAFQGPDVLPQGKTEVGVGITGAGALGDDEGGGVGLIELYGRYGVSPRFEIGARTTGFLAAEGIVLGAVMMEGKYQFVTRSPQVAVGMGISYYGLELENERFSTVGLYPSLWIGSPRLYTGARMLIVTMGSTGSDEVGTGSLAGVTVGGVIGNRMRLRPELTLYKPLYEGGNGWLWVVGLGMALRLGGQ